MSDKRPTYKERNGTTRVGDFLRGINKDKLIDVAAEIVTGDLGGAVKAIFKSPELSEAEKERAALLVELDIAEQQGVTERWSSDMRSDSYLSKNVRPLSLVFLTVATVVLIFADFFMVDMSVPTEWIDLLKSLLLGIYVAYFGSRGLEKAQAIRKNI